MYSRKDFRDVPSADVSLPREVYYRCLWTVRDSDRLEKLAAMPGIAGREYAGADTSSGDQNYLFSADSVIVTEAACRQASSDLDCIRAAIGRIPEVYREGLLDNIRRKTPFPDFAHPNTWKRWKLIFLYELAKELCLI